ncbi:hypothetical protein D9M68_106810 [compost metagenome]
MLETIMKLNHFAMGLATAVAIGSVLASNPTYAAGFNPYHDGAKSTFNPYADGARGRFNPYADGAREKFNPYSDGLRTSRFDVYTDGARD